VAPPQRPTAAPAGGTQAEGSGPYVRTYVQDSHA
jgi:hypothetical protein